MLKREVTLGTVYAVKVGSRVRPVQVTHEATIGGGWYGRNLATGRTVRIRSAAKLRCEVQPTPDGRFYMPVGKGRTYVPAII